MIEHLQISRQMTLEEFISKLTEDQMTNFRISIFHLFTVSNKLMNNIEAAIISECISFTLVRACNGNCY